MATHLGSEGTVKIGSNAVAEIVEWSLDESANIIGDSAQSDAWETNKAGRKSGAARSSACGTRRTPRARRDDERRRGNA